MIFSTSDLAARACEIPEYHLADRIQPHAVLVGLDPRDLTIACVSANAQRLFGADATSLLGAPIGDLLEGSGSGEAGGLAAAMHGDSSTPGRMLSGLKLRGGSAGAEIDAWFHVAGGTPCLEFFLPGSDVISGGPAEPDFVLMVDAVSNFEGPIDELGQLLCDSASQLLGFDRVYLCLFDENGHGYVPAEKRQGAMPSLLRHYFPRTDVPQRIRSLYARNRFRLIPDSGAAPVPLLGRQGGGTPLDLSASSCREIAATHLQYLRGMGAVASTSFSILNEGSLAGLLGGHHHAPRQASHRQLLRCTALASAYSNRSAVLRMRRQRRRLKAAHGQIVEITKALEASGCDILELVSRSGELLHNMFDADGVIAADESRLHSTYLSHDEALPLIEWCRGRAAHEGVFSTHGLSREAPEFTALREAASGVFAISLDRAARKIVVLLRREVRVDRKWSGDPNSAVRSTPSGGAEPRKSFETYIEHITGTSPPWGSRCRDLAASLQHAISRTLASRFAEDARAAAEHANDLKSDFLANISHELRTPMHSIIGFADSLLQRGDTIPVERRQRYLEVIQASGNRLLDLINDLLDLSRLEAKRVAPSLASTAPRPIAEECLAEIAPLAEKRAIRIRLVDRWSGGPVMFDRAMISRVLINLLSNAVKFTPEGGSVEVSLAAGRLRSSFAPCLEITVSDTGIGIPADELESVFDKFVQSSKTRDGSGGTGLGLSICRSILAQHGGEIWAESPATGGARIVAQVPWTSAEAGLPARAAG